jgi:hypothetical protein
MEPHRRASAGPGPIARPGEAHERLGRGQGFSTRRLPEAISR